MHTRALLPGKEPRRRGTSSCRWSCTWRFFPRSSRRRTSHRRRRSSTSPAEPWPFCPGPAWRLAPLLPRIPFPLQHRTLVHYNKIITYPTYPRCWHIWQCLSGVVKWNFGRWCHHLGDIWHFSEVLLFKTRWHCLMDKLWKQQMTWWFHSYFRTPWKSLQGSHVQNDNTMSHSTTVTVGMKEETWAHPSSSSSSGPPQRRPEDRRCLPFAFPASLWAFVSAAARSSADTEPTSRKSSVQTSAARKEEKH